jgi:subtilisin family serine protease
MYLNQYTGRGIRVAVIDSGVHVSHPHIVEPPAGGEADPAAAARSTDRPIVTGVGIREDGSLDDDYTDRLGHGTAVAAAIREKAPDAQIVAIKVFWRRLATDVPTLVRGIEEACARGASVINLSLGTTDVTRRAELQAAISRAVETGAIVVSATGDEDIRWLPGSLDDIVPVRLDWGCPRDAYRVARDGARPVIVASGYPREIPGVPRERNLKGISFAVANATGFVARAREAAAAARTGQLLDMLAAAACDDACRTVVQEG